MSCKHWNDAWIAGLYGEQDEPDASACAGHLAACAECRTRMERLAGARAALRECEGQVPAAPRVLILEPRPSFRRTWTFAAGAACALAAFAVGLWASPHLGLLQTAASAPASDTTAAAVETAADRAAEIDRLLEAQQGLERRLAVLEHRPDATEQLARFEARLAAEREQDLQAVLRSMTAAERRTGTWMNETREVLQVLALRQDPRLLER